MKWRSYMSTCTLSLASGSALALPSNSSTTTACPSLAAAIRAVIPSSDFAPTSTPFSTTNSQMLAMPRCAACHMYAGHCPCIWAKKSQITGHHLHPMVKWSWSYTNAFHPFHLFPFTTAREASRMPQLEHTISTHLGCKSKQETIWQQPLTSQRLSLHPGTALE